MLLTSFFFPAVLPCRMQKCGACFSKFIAWVCSLHWYPNQKVTGTHPPSRTLKNLLAAGQDYALDIYSFCILGLVLLFAKQGTCLSQILLITWQAKQWMSEMWHPPLLCEAHDWAPQHSAARAPHSSQAIPLPDAEHQAGAGISTSQP